MNTELVLNETKKVIRIGTGFGINLKKDMIDALGIIQGSLLKVTIQNTGIVMNKRKAKAEETTETPEEVEV